MSLESNDDGDIRRGRRKTSSLHEPRDIAFRTSFVQKLAGVKSIGLCGRGFGAIVKGTCARESIQQMLLQEQTEKKKYENYF